jgi:hypothetical protein
MKLLYHAFVTVHFKINVKNFHPHLDAAVMLESTIPITDWVLTFKPSVLFKNLKSIQSCRAGETLNIPHSTLSQRC